MSFPDQPDHYTTNRTFYEAVEIAKICAAITHKLTGGDATSLDLSGLWDIPVTNWSEDTRSHLLLPGLTGSSPEQLRARLDGLITYLRFGPETQVPTEMSCHPATVEHHAHLLWKALEDEGLFALMQQDQSEKMRICMEVASDITKCLVDDSDATTDNLKVLAGSIQFRGSELQATYREHTRSAFISSLGDLVRSMWPFDRDDSPTGTDRTVAVLQGLRGRTTPTVEGVAESAKRLYCSARAYEIAHAVPDSW
jgi:hypothetical protein